MFPFFNKPFFRSLANQGQLRTLDVSTPFGRVVFQSNQLDEETFKNFESRFAQVQTQDEYEKLCMEMKELGHLASNFDQEFEKLKQEMNKLMEDTHSLLERKRPYFSNLFNSIHHNLTEQDIDEQIAELQKLKEEVKEKSVKDELKKQITALEQALSAKGQELITVLDRPEEVQKINDEMFKLHTDLKQLKEELAKLES